jgi:hypothetical protein
VQVSLRDLVGDLGHDQVVLRHAVHRIGEELDDQVAVMREVDAWVMLLAIAFGSDRVDELDARLKIGAQELAVEAFTIASHRPFRSFVLDEFLNFFLRQHWKFSTASLAFNFLNFSFCRRLILGEH